jgi:uncharacterized protein
MPTRRTIILTLTALVLTWVALTLSSAWVHVQLWTDPREPQLVHHEPHPAVRALGSVQHIILAPGWVIARRLFDTWPTHTLAGALVASALGWAIVLTGVIALLVTRQALLKHARPKGAHAEQLGGTPQAPMPPEPPQPPTNPARRKLLIDGTLAAGALAASSSLAYATLIEPQRIALRRYRIPIRDLPASLVGTRLVILADTHLGPRVSASFIEDAVAQAIALKPHVFALLGDYIHDGISHIDAAADLFKPLVATGTPVVGVLGNHDWYGNGPRTAAALRNAGIHILDHTRLLLTEQRTLQPLAPGKPDLRSSQGPDGTPPSPTPEGIALAGWGDLLEDHIDVDRSLGNLPPDLPRIVLSHNPDASLLIAQGVPGKYQSRFRKVTPRLVDSSRGTSRIDLMLSGHTHGGQVALPFIGPPIVPSRFGTRFAGGLCQGPTYPVIVTRGLGMSILPVRFNCPPELVEVELTRA